MPKDKDDGIGYCRPPLETRFRPGISGNPSGRPKRQKSLSEEIASVLNEATTIVENGKKRETTKGNAIAREVVKRATAGDLRAISMVLSCSAGSDENSENATLTPAEIEIIESLQHRETKRLGKED